MAEPTPPNVVCTPFVGRTIKGWTVRIRLCFSVTEAVLTSTNFGNDVLIEGNTLAGLINALSDATFSPVGFSWASVDYTYGATGVTDNAEDSAVFSFVSTQGTIVKTSIPAPKDSIFLADNMTVDPGNTAVAAFVAELLSTTAFTGVMSSKGGAQVAAFLGGLRVRRKTRRKMNIFVKDPGLTTPAI